MSKKIMGVTVGTPIRPSKFASELADRVEEMVKANTEQEKTVDITENGTVEIVPDEGYKLTKVTANVNVSGENKLAQLVDGTITEITAQDLEGITEIRSNAFYRANNLISVAIPNGVTTLNGYSFANCSNLENVTFPNTLTHIDEYVFNNDKKLINITFPNTLETIYNYAFNGCESLTDIIIPDSVISTGGDIFRNCINLKTAVIGNGLPDIKGYMFYNCTSLDTVVIGNNVSDIGNSAFYNCQSLVNLTIPAKVEFIGTHLTIGTTTNKATITLLGTTPPNIYATTFSNTNLINKIIVPAGYGDVYKSATNWANVAEFIEEASV